MAINMKYGGYSLVPAPLITVSKDYQKNSAGIAIGTILRVGLNGNIINISGTDGLPVIMSGVRNLRNAFDRDGKYFQIACDNNTLFEGYPRIVDSIQFSESPDNWINTCPYSLTLEFDNEPANINITGSGENIPGLMPPYISSYEDSWSFEFDDQFSSYSLSTASGVDTGPIVLRASHEVSAIGKSHWDGPGLSGTLTKKAWQWAKDFVSTRLNTSPIGTLGSGVFNLALSGFGQYNHFRVQRIGESEGTFNVTETYIINSRNSGVLEDFTVEVRSGLQDPYSTVAINGSVQGLESRTYGTNSGDFSITTTKYASASGYYETIKDTALIFPRAQALVNIDNITLNSTPISKSVGRSPGRGLITYNYEYDNRPTNCITGAKTESIQINDENPTDVFSKITIMGRSQGPIIQSFNTVTEFRRTVSIDVLMNPSTGCSISSLTGGNNPNGQATSILCGFETDLRSRYSKVYKERDNKSWEPKFGRYNRSVTWIAVDCNTAPAISLCSGA